MDYVNNSNRDKVWKPIRKGTLQATGISGPYHSIKPASVVPA
jgi:hypothetical protein